MTVSRNPSVALSDAHRRLVDDLVASGRYQGVSEVVRAGLRLLEDSEARRARALAEIERAVQAGLASDPAGALELDAIVADAERRALDPADR